MGKRVMAAMSGGVDSTVAAVLLTRMGYETSGGTMRLSGLNSENESIEGAAAVCLKLGIPHFVFDKRLEFRDRVMSFFAESYIDGLTPNPCVFCNKTVKFPEFMSSAEREGYDFIATGHYAGVEYDKSSGRWTLRKGVDSAKDQSYFLFGLTQDILSKTIFPLGELTKKEVREIAREFGMRSAERPDSQDICFLGQSRDYMAFLRDEFGYEQGPGDFLDRDGNVLGKHTGAAGYTIGQRRGLGVSSPDGRLYVTGKDMVKNTVTLGKARDIETREVHVDGINFVSIAPTKSDFNAQVKLRYSKDSHPARVVMTGENSALLELSETQRTPAPGQAAVFYDGDILLGGGTIV